MKRLNNKPFKKVSSHSVLINWWLSWYPALHCYNLQYFRSISPVTVCWWWRVIYILDVVVNSITIFCNRQRLITRKKRLRLPLNDLAVIKKVTLHIEIQCVKKPISIRRVDSHCYIMNNKWCTLWKTSHLMLINMLYIISLNIHKTLLYR